MRLRPVLDAVVVTAAAVAAAPIVSATPIQVAVVIALALAAVALLSPNRAQGGLAVDDARADVLVLTALAARPALLAPLTVSRRLRC